MRPGPTVSPTPARNSRAPVPLGVSQEHPTFFSTPPQPRDFSLMCLVKIKNTLPCEDDLR